MLSRKAARPQQGAESSLAPVYSARDLSEEIPRYRLPERSSAPRVVAQLIEDELNLDGNASLNLASFVTTWMEPEAESLMARTLSKNFVDAEEYPQTAELADRCVNMIADLFHAPEETGATGTATVGSSEAIHLAGLAMKWRWKKQRGAAAGSVTPNIVMGANVQVCWEKFARYFEVEPRYVPMTTTRYVLGVDEALSMVDENTIGVVGILGSTYTGEYEPVDELASALDQLQHDRDIDVPIHVDAASGGFVAPFNSPELTWDFRLPRVKSINTSGHKYGLVYPGIGWSIWREAELLPDELVFHVNYLGGDHPTFNLNFSRGSSQIVAQYYNLLRLGRQGYAKVMSALASTATWISSELEATGRFTLLSKTDALPVVCFRLTSQESWTVFDLSAALRERGWIVPAYTLAPNASEIAVLRIVVREGLGRDLAQTLLADIRAAMERLDSGHVPASPMNRRKGAASTSRAPHHHNPGHGVC